MDFFIQISGFPFWLSHLPTGLILVKWHDYSEPQFLYVSDDNNTYFIGSPGDKRKELENCLLNILCACICVCVCKLSLDLPLLCPLSPFFASAWAWQAACWAGKCPALAPACFIFSTSSTHLSRIPFVDGKEYFGVRQRVPLSSRIGFISTVELSPEPCSGLRNNTKFSGPWLKLTWIFCP